MEPRYFIGLDVHKATTTYAVRDRTGQILAEGQTATIFDDLYDQLAVYLSSGIVALEASTSYYTLYQAFLRNGYDAKVVNTLQLRQLISKNDKLDARRLADMMRLGTLPCSFIPDQEIQHLRNLVRIRHSLVEEKTRWKNRIQALVDRIGLEMPPRGPFTKIWKKHLQRHLGTQEASIELRCAFDHYELLEQRAERLDQEMIGYSIKHWKKEHEIIQSIPGFGPVLACYIIAEVLPISRFASKKKLRRYAGVVPVSNESGGTVYKGRIPKASSRSILRWALVQAANAATRTKTPLAKYYRKKKKQKGNTAMAKVALASSISDILFTVLTKKTPYARKEEPESE